MAQIINVEPAENGTAIITLTPRDASGTVLPIERLKTPKWQLQKTDGTIVNSRSFAACPITALTWVLFGDDLALSGSSDSGIRILGIQATYDSSLGDDLPLNAEGRFTIDRLLSQADAG